MKSSVEPEQLALAGFRYSGQASGTDMVRCDYCSGRLQRWEETDEPLQEHARHYPDCPFLHPLTQQHKNPQVSNFTFEKRVIIVNLTKMLLGKSVIFCFRRLNLLKMLVRIASFLTLFFIEMTIGMS